MYVYNRIYIFVYAYIYTTLDLNRCLSAKHDLHEKPPAAEHGSLEWIITTSPPNGWSWSYATNEKNSTNELRKLLEDFPTKFGLKFENLLILYKISVGGCFPEPGGQSDRLCIRWKSWFPVVVANHRAACDDNYHMEKQIPTRLKTRNKMTRERTTTVTLTRSHLN